MNARKRLRFVLAIALALTAVSAGAEPVREIIEAGNELYTAGEYTEAINKYNEALVEEPGAVEPKFNKANSYYRLDDLGEAIDLFQEVAAESKDMSMVAKAKYNLGNCLFQRGRKQMDADLNKAVEDMEKSITYWRGVLDIEPENEKAARNIEVARLTLKDLLDRLKKQQEEQDKQQQQDQSNQQNQQQQQEQQQNQGQDQQQGDQQQQDQSKSQQDPNQPQDPNEAQGQQDKQDPNQPEDQQQGQQDQEDQQDQQGQSQQQNQEKVMAPDATAQEILDKEQRRKEQHRVRQRAQGGKVEKDW